MRIGPSISTQTSSGNRAYDVEPDEEPGVEPGVEPDEEPDVEPDMGFLRISMVERTVLWRLTGVSWMEGRERGWR